MKNILKQKKTIENNRNGQNIFVFINRIAIQAAMKGQHYILTCIKLIIFCTHILKYQRGNFNLSM